MSRKRPPRATRKAHSQKPRRRPGSSPGRGLDDRELPPAVRVLARHRSGFVRWAELTTPHGEDTSGRALYEVVELLLGAASWPAGLNDPTRCTPEQVAALATVLVEDEWPVDEAAAALHAFAHVLDYLEDADQWRGTPDDLAGCQEVLALLDSSSPHAVAAALSAIGVDPAHQETAVQDLPLVEQAGALLSWVRRGPGGSRQVTATGALRRADLVEAAAIVGVTVHTVPADPGQTAEQGGQLTLERLPARPDLPVGSVRGMSDVLPLARVWQAFATLTIVDVGRTSARLGGLGVDWLDGPGQQRLRARAVFLVAYLVHTFEETDRLPWAMSRGMMTAQVLLSLLLLGQRRPDQLDADIPGFALLGRHDLERLAALGIVCWDDGLLGVTPGLEQLVAGAVRLFLFDDTDTDGDVAPGSV